MFGCDRGDAPFGLALVGSLLGSHPARTACMHPPPLPPAARGSCERASVHATDAHAMLSTCPPPGPAEPASSARPQQMHDEFKQIRRPLNSTQPCVNDGDSRPNKRGIRVHLGRLATDHRLCAFRAPLMHGHTTRPDPGRPQYSADDLSTHRHILQLHAIWVVRTASP